jgi:phage-related minor tail protein
VVTKSRGLATTVAQFVGGQASASDVKTAANQLSTAVDKAKADLKPQVSKNLDSAQAGVQRLQKALTTQPVSKSEISSAAAQVVTSVGSAATVCKTS